MEAVTSPSKATPVKSNHQRFRSETQVKERPDQAKELPRIKFNGTTDYLSPPQKSTLGGDIRTDRSELSNYVSKARNQHAHIHRTIQNSSQIEGYLPKLNLKQGQFPSMMSSIQSSAMSTNRGGEDQVPNSLLCNKYKKVYSYKTSPRELDSQLQQMTHEDQASVQQLPGMRRLDRSGYKLQTFNRAFYMWNQWNFKDESIQGATKHKVRDQVQLLKEEFKIMRYQQELLSLQRKRNLIESYYREHKGKPAPLSKF